MAGVFHGAVLLGWHEYCNCWLVLALSHCIPTSQALMAAPEPWCSGVAGLNKWKISTRNGSPKLPKQLQNRIKLRGSAGFRSGSYSQGAVGDAIGCGVAAPPKIAQKADENLDPPGVVKQLNGPLPLSTWRLTPAGSYLNWPAEQLPQARMQPEKETSTGSEAT